LTIGEKKNMSAEDSIKTYLAKGIGRREFIKQLRAIGVTAGAEFSYAELLGGCSLPPAGSSTEVTGAQAPVALNHSEFKVLEAISGRILPTTDSGSNRSRCGRLYRSSAGRSL
jgi:hypothetical protein